AGGAAALVEVLRDGKPRGRQLGQREPLQHPPDVGQVVDGLVMNATLLEARTRGVEIAEAEMNFADILRDRREAPASGGEALVRSHGLERSEGPRVIALRAIDPPQTFERARLA